MTHFVHIPLRGSDQVLQLPIDYLSSVSVKDIVRILTDEEAPTKVWISTAVGYYNIGLKDQFIEILQIALQNLPSSQNRERNKKKILDTIAAYYAERAYQSSDTRRRKTYIERVNEHISSSENLDNHSPNTWLTKAFFYLLTNDFERASQQITYIFKNQLPLDEDYNTAALIARGIVEYHQKKFEKALTTFREAVKENCLCIEELRVAFGLCYYQLGRVKLAERWFDRALDVDPKNVDALLGLAVIEFNQPNLRDRKRLGYGYIVQAYKVDPEHPRVLNYLARYFFHRRDYSKAENLALQSAQLAKSPLIKAESKYIQGRIHQVQREFGLALRDFQSVIDVIPDHALARHGLAQMCMFLNTTKDLTMAVEHLKHILQTKKQNTEVLKFLGSLEAKEKRNNTAMKYFEQVVLLVPEDWEAWIELAQLKEMDDPAGSLRAYEAALDAQIKEIAKNQSCSLSVAEKAVPSELWNNVGALRFREEQYKRAESAFLCAIEGSEHKLTEFHAENNTTTYNLARVYEETNRSREAMELYIGILKEFPAMVDCYLRLGCISFSQNQTASALQWIRCAIELDTKNADGWTLKGQHFFKERDWQKAQEQFETILKEISKEDHYAALSLANIYYYALGDRRNARDAEKYTKHASNFYRQVLRSQPHNLSAICGLGCVLATIGHLEEAQSCFTLVRENGKHSVLRQNSWINLGHIFMKHKRYTMAAQMYSKCLKNFKTEENDLLLYLAYCHFCSDNLLESKRFVLKAIHLNPTDSTLWYNLAVIQSEYGAHVRRKKRNASQRDVSTARVEVTQAKALFEKLLRKAKDPKYRRKYSSEACSNEVARCKSLLGSLDSLATEVQKHEESQRLKAEKYKKADELAKELARKEEEERERKRKEEEQRRAEELAKREEEQQETLRKWAEMDKKKNRAKEDEEPPRKKQKTKNTVQEDSDSEPEYQEKMPTIYENETVDEMRSRKGGHLERLQAEIENEKAARKQKEIDEIRNKFGESDQLEQAETSSRKAKTPEKQLVRDRLEEVISALDEAELITFRASKMKGLLVKAGVPKPVLREYSSYAKTLAVKLIRQRTKRRK